MEKKRIVRTGRRYVSGEPARVYEVDSLIEARVRRNREKNRRKGRVIVKRNKEFLE